MVVTFTTPAGANQKVIEGWMFDWCARKTVAKKYNPNLQSLEEQANKLKTPTHRMSHLRSVGEELPVTLGGLQREEQEKSQWWVQFEGYLEDTGIEADGWEVAVGNARTTKQFLKWLGYSD